MVDIRTKAAVKEEGVPDLKQTKKKLLSLPFVVVRLGLCDCRALGG